MKIKSNKSKTLFCKEDGPAPPAQIYYTFFLCIFFLFILGCKYSEESPILFFDENGGSEYLAAHSKEAAAGEIRFEKNGEYVYSLSKEAVFGENSSLEIEYEINMFVESDESAALKTGLESWSLPFTLDFLQQEISRGESIRYKTPLVSSGGENSIKELHITTRGVKGSNLVMRIKSFKITPRELGFSLSGGGVELTPFVTFVKDRDAYIISPPQEYKISGRAQVVSGAAQFGAKAVFAERAFNCLPHPGGDGLFLTFPSAAIGPDPYPVEFSGRTSRLLAVASQTPPFPEPRLADAYFVLNFPQVSWRDERYEVFRWESFPSILIFDTAGYAAQDRLFKRLAFFSEKKGFRGKLLKDEEMADSHGWNAHDYSARTLAAFFNLVKEKNFQINKEEEELREILLSNNIIRETATGIAEGRGAVVSISRESGEYLRLLFMAHEGFHGIFFIDEEFRNFAYERWKNLDGAAKRFLVSYFDYQQYDINDEYLIVNEFMAYVMQQSAGAASEYFGKTIPSRINEISWRRGALPAYNEETGLWTDLAKFFSAEAAAFSAYARSRWALDCGRVWRLRK
jgi:hypothetical protein